MRYRRDFYTPLLPFDEFLRDPTRPNNPLTPEEVLLNVLKIRLIRYLSIEKKLPTKLPALKLLPSLNKSMGKDNQIKFTEELAINFLKELGAIIEPNPSYLGRSRYRVTISQDLANKLLENKD
ncbi:MAG: hypothetical protein HY819_15205 [Acidobacteria bacterium]|nr:hypothetical protein [Acidobacteriota bacterium]